jgi:hypothetical protein
MFVPPAILGFLGDKKLRNNEKGTAKIYFIVAGAYLLIGLGLCGSMLTSM